MKNVIPPVMLLFLLSKEDYAAAPMGNTFARHLVSMGASIQAGMKSIMDPPGTGSVKQ